MRRSTLSLTAVWLLVHFAGLPAQNPPPFEPGARVSISAPDYGVRRLVGTFSGYEGGNVGVKPDQGQSSVWVPLTSVTNFKRSSGLKSNAGQGALLGLLAGGVVGAVVGAATYEKCQAVGFMACFMSPNSAGEQAVLGGLAGVLLGAGLGAIVGANVKTDRWEEVPLDRLRVGFVPRRDGFELVMSVTF